MRPRPRARAADPGHHRRVIACVDVDYGAGVTRAALVGFTDWLDAAPAVELVDEHPPNPAAYHPGAFYQRELPYLLPLLARAPAPLDVVIVDGYVWLGPDRPGLGAHLHDALPAPRPAIVGVAKTRFTGAPGIPITRGASATPLHVTALGIDTAAVAARIVAMHGPYRLPTLLKRVDTLARGR